MRLDANLKSSRTVSANRVALLALGNTGDKAVFGAALPYLASPDSTIRSAAITALRWVPDARAPTLIAKALVVDRSPEVRDAAARALGYVAPNKTTVAALRGALRGDAEAQVRESALESLWQARTAFPAVIADIREAATKDHAEEVRKAAKALLDRASK